MINERQIKKIPIILDTDIGWDIDDTWALAMLLRCPELDIKLVSTCTGDTAYRAKIVAKLLQTAGRSEIPIAVGLPTPPNRPQEPQLQWLKDYDLDQYPGPVFSDGIQAIVDTIMNASEPITLISIGPLQNIAAALKLQPQIAQKSRFIGMQGSVRKGYDDSDKIVAEYNVIKAIAECQTVFTAPWPVTITPLDTCGLIRLTGEQYQTIMTSSDPLLQALIENYRLWSQAMGGDWPNMFPHQSTILFDTVAVYLAFSEALLTMEDLPIRVTDDGYTRIDPQGKQIRCATSWKDLEKFHDFLVERLTATTCRSAAPG